MPSFDRKNLSRIFLSFFLTEEFRECGLSRHAVRREIYIKLHDFGIIGAKLTSR